MIRLDIKKWTVQIKEKPVFVTRSEFKVLRRLAMSEGEVVTRGSLIRDVFKGSATNRNVDYHVCQLRGKLPVGAIRTVWGVGYSVQGVKIA